MAAPLRFTGNTRITVLFFGFMISLVGSLPPGTTNILMVQLASGRAETAFLFAAGCLAAEMIYVMISMAMTRMATRFQIFQRALRWISVIILIAFAFSSFVAAEADARPVSVLLPETFSPFVFGFVMMAVNPMQIPFWFGWTTILFERKILIPGGLHYSLYAIGAVIGSITASLLFILAGHFISTSLLFSQRQFHWVLGAIFLFTALYQVWKNGRAK